MARPRVRTRVADAVDARSIGVVCFGAGIVAYWALREAGEYFAALVPLFLVGIAGLLLGYSNGYDRGRDDATSRESDAETDREPDASVDETIREEPRAESD